VATDILDVLRTKRDGGTLSDEQIRFFIEGYTDGSIADEQAAALCMAILLRDMGGDELATWTQAMIDSGERLDLSGVGRPTVDKHSTGGVGDKVSLILAPLVAACGAAVPQLSGRGLGHTGGTLDKLEAIPGWRATLGNDEMIAQLRDVGAVICAASEALCPADRKLYALRDVTATVEAIPLIASSIMSKKIAEGTSSLVLDVKFGSGAFLPGLDQARRLAETMVGLGQAHGVRTVALLTDMESPLGRTAGNGLEVAESVATLRGEGPADLTELVLALAREMLALAGLGPSPGAPGNGPGARGGVPGGHGGAVAGAPGNGPGAPRGAGAGGPGNGPGGPGGPGAPAAWIDPAAALADGRALAVWDEMIRAQGGDPAAPLAEAAVRHEVVAPTSGYLTRLDARAVGIAVWRLGAGRSRKEDPVSPSAGAVCLRKPGDRVEEGEPVLVLHADDPDRLGPALAALDDAAAVAVGPEPPAPRPLVAARIA
jgi:thymidine phosphorylase